MPDLTINYSFKKPLVTEVVDIAIINENFDDIDSKIKELDDENCKMTASDLTLLINSEADYDAMVALLNVIAHNDYTIQIDPASTYNPTNAKDLKFSNIKGSGSISFPVAWDINNLSIIDVGNRVTFTELSVRKTSTETNGLYLKNSPDVTITTLSCGIPVSGAFASASDNRIKLENSVLNSTTFSMDGNFTWTQNPYYFIYIDSKSRFNINVGGSCAITCNALPSAHSLGYGVIKIEEGGYFEEKITPTFTNWNNIFVCQIYAEKYEFDYDVLATATTDEDAGKIEDLLASIKTINSTLTIDLGDFRTGDLAIEHIDGAGNLEIDKIQITATELFLANNINCNLYLSNIEITDGDPLGGLYLSDCRYFELIGDVISTITDVANRAITLQNSKGVVEGYQPSAATTQANAANQILISDTCDVVFKDVDSTVYDAAFSVAAIYNGSKVIFEKCTKPADPKYVTIVLNDPGCITIARDVTLAMVQFIDAGSLGGNSERIY